MFHNLKKTVKNLKVIQATFICHKNAQAVKIKIQ